MLLAQRRVRGMAAAAAHAGLLRPEQLEAHLEAWTRRVAEAYLSTLDELERIKADAYLVNVRNAAEREWNQSIGRISGNGVSAPRVDATYPRDGDTDVVQLSDAVDGGTGDEDRGGRRLHVPHVRKELAQLQDCTKLRALTATLSCQGN